MLASLIVALDVMVGVAALVLVLAWLLDLVWMTFMRLWVSIVTVLTFAALFAISGNIVAASNVRLVLAVALTTLVVRPMVDLLTWLYDIAPLEVMGNQPFLHWEARDEYRTRMSEAPPQWEWDYFRQRCRASQEVDFRSTVIFSDGPMDDETDDERPD